MKKWPVMLTAFLLGAVSVSAAQETVEWRELTTAHFHLVSNADAKTTQQLGQRLERYRQVLELLFPRWELDPPPLSHVFVFRDKESFQPYNIFSGQQLGSLVGGYMLSLGKDRMHLAVHLGSLHRERAAVHEYMHLISRRNFSSLPIWLEEGLAGLLENSNLQDQVLELGRLPASDWRQLRERDLIPVRQLVHLSLENAADKLGEDIVLFRAQSLLLTQFLFVAGEGKHRSSFLLFLHLTGKGVAQDKAFATAFQTDWDSLDDMLQEYVRQTAPAVLRIPVPPPEKEALPELSPLTFARSQAYLAELWLIAGRVKQAEELLRSLAAEGIADAEVQYFLGRIELERGRAREAEKHFRAGIRLNPSAAHLRYFAVLAFFRGRLGDLTGKEELRPAMSEIVELLTPLLEEPLTYPEAYRLLVNARSLRGDSPKELIPLVEKARKVLPRQGELDLLLGHLFVREERWVEARRVFTRLLSYTKDKEEREDAREWLKFLRTVRPEPTVKFAKETEEDAGQPGTAPPVKDIAYVRGILAEVECRGDEGQVLTVHARNGEGKPKEVRVKLLSSGRVLLFDRKASGQGIRCDSAGASVAIYYRAEQEAAGVTGRVLTLELYPTGR